MFHSPDLWRSTSADFRRPFNDFIAREQTIFYPEHTSLKINAAIKCEKFGHSPDYFFNAMITITLLELAIRRSM